MMWDVVVGIGLVMGSSLAALGGLGLLRFPDVFTRMHAATKAATVGVILMTAAAGLSVGAGGLAASALVMALLFLSAPLGMSLLARAAYHDPETPRFSQTIEIAVFPNEPETASVLRTGGTSPTLALWLFLLWIAVFGSVRGNVVLSGAVVAGVTAYAFRRFAPRWPGALLSPLALARFVGYFGTQLAAATWDVTRALVVPTADLRPVILDVPLTVTTRNEVAFLMNAVSFTPGTVALELHDDHLYLHVLSTKPIDEVADGIATMQRRIAESFGGPPPSGNSNRVMEDV